MVALRQEYRKPYLIYSNNQPVKKESRPYRALGAALEAWRSGRREVLLAGPAGCIAGETRLYDPIQDKHIAIKDLYQRQQAPVVQTLWGPAQAEVPFIKGVARLYRVTTVSGKTCLVTGNHRVLTPHGWSFVSACSSGESILISAPNLQERCLEPVLLASQRGALHLNYRDVGYLDGCLQDCRQCDVLPQWEAETDRAFVLLRDDVLLRSRVDLQMDDRVYARGRNPLASLSSFHLSTLDYSHRIEQTPYAQNRVFPESLQLYDDWSRYGEQSQREILPLLPTGEPRRYDDSTHRLQHHLVESHASSGGDELDLCLHLQLPEEQYQYSMFSDNMQESLAFALSSDAYNLSKLTSNGLIPFGKYHYTVQWDTVSSIEYERTDEYFDLHVPMAEHYLAEGVWHHNTGKSRAALQKVHFCAQKYPGARILICRKTRHSISQTAMVTYEKKVLPDGWLDKYVHFNTTEQQYEYVNGSVIAVGGLDKPSKIMSSEWDMIYPQEAIELLEEDWEALTTRLRNGLMPYQQLIGDTNPGPPTHWLKKRCDRGATKMLHSRHEDNPSVTPEYLATLDALTGVRKKRLRDGLWAAAEGMVYDEWDPAIHIITKKQLHERQILIDDQINHFAIRRFVAGVDWGYKNPGVIQVYGVDGDGRKYLFREVYQTRKLIDWWVEKAVALHQEFDIETFFCDPSEPAYISQFNEAGLNAVGATNDIIPGIDTMKRALAVQPDGRPGFYVYEYALQERDQLRDENNQPVCFENEVNEYVYEQDKGGRPVKELPVKLNDHSMDAARYVCMGVDGNMMLRPLELETVSAISSYVGY